MIRLFKHKGLKRLYEGKPQAKVKADHRGKLRRILTALDETTMPEEMDLPGFHLHRLKGKLKDHYAVTVSGNYRVTFRFEGQHAVDVDYVDYH